MNTDTCEVVQPTTAFDRLVLPMLRDERDLIFARNLALASLVVPVGLSFYAWDFPLWLAPIYWACTAPVLWDKVGLMIHVVIHRPLFKRQFRFVDHYLTGLLCMFFGHTPHTFFIHHIGMHHAENNMEDDTSSTMAYQRDSLLGFLHYWLMFLVFGTFILMGYHARKRKWRLVRMLAMVEGGWMLLMIALALINFKATFVVFLMPVFLMRFFLMCGNWAQHSMVDATDPDNPFKRSITLLNARHNRRCYNDGYHVTHHRFPAMHYSEMPAAFEANKQEYIDNDSVVFSEIMGYQHLWVLLMMKDYEKMADHYVDLSGKNRSREEIIALLKERVRPIVR